MSETNEPAFETPLTPETDPAYVEPVPTPEPIPEPVPEPSNKPKKLLLVDGNEPQEVDLTDEEIAGLLIVEPVYYKPITRRQLRLWLLSQGKRDNDVRQAINAIEDPIMKEAAIIEWEDSTIYERNHPLISQIGVALGLTTEQIDQGFLGASNL